MKVVIDIEANALVNPTQIWVVVCKDIETNSYHIFRNLTEDVSERNRFINWINGVELVIGHNILGYDIPVMGRLLKLTIPIDKVLDTLICSKLIDCPRQGHSIEDYGLEFGIPKGKFVDFSKYTEEMEQYCIRDVDICHKVYLKYYKYIQKEEHKASLDLEHKFQVITNELSTNGFFFNNTKATMLLNKVQQELSILDKDILESFVPKLKYIRTIVPKSTKYNTISLSSIPKVLRDSIDTMTIDAPFCHCHWVEFNPSSHKQIVDVLNEAQWRPIDKTQTHIDTERELNKLKYNNKRSTELDIRVQELHNKLSIMKKAGWKVNETNLETLPGTAPQSARTLAKRILLESRRRTLTEWLDLVCPEDGRIHGKFYGIGAWTHRMAHQNPNTANIPNEFDTAGKKKLYGKELRSLWCAPKNRLLVGVDAEGIQLRIFAHYINDPEFTRALVEGRKDDKTDPHSLNQRILGSACKSRAAAKRFIYALLLGAGMGKLSEILGCSASECEEALDRLMSRYTGWAHLKEDIFPKDARRGYLIGLDGRKVRIPGDTESSRRHLAMSGYLQNGEAVVMKRATLKWHDKLKEYDALLVNLVHDEWQVEAPNNVETCITIASTMAESLKSVGMDLNLNCPLAGSYWNDDDKDYTIATNWSKTH